MAASTNPINKLVLTQPDDWHHHLRDGAKLETLVPAASKRFRRCIVMPNLVPPVRTTAEALSYRDRIMGALPKDGSESSKAFQVSHVFSILSVPFPSRLSTLAPPKSL